MGKKTVAVAIHVYRRPAVLENLIKNIKWSGWPDCPVYVFEDHSIDKGEADEISEIYREICQEYNLPHKRSLAWGCMQGVSEFAMHQTKEDWIVWVPDDVLFTKGSLVNEVDSVQRLGEPYIGGIQISYWNSQDLQEMGLMPADKNKMYTGWIPEGIPSNAHWDNGGVPRIYANFNGAGFIINRTLWKRMGGYDIRTWRLDEYAGFKAWQLGMPIVTLPGPPRIHYFGGSGDLRPGGLVFQTEGAYVEALGMNIGDAITLMRGQMALIPKRDESVDATWDDVTSFFNDGGSLPCLA